MITATRGSAKAKRLPRLPLRRPRTLLVEDDFTALRRRSDLLRMKDLDVIGATSKGEALDRLRAVSFRVDMVLTDLNLVPGEGLREAVEVAEAVAARSDQSVPIYAYSGKIRDLPESSMHLFKDVVLKTAPSSRVREVFNKASRDAQEHFAESVEYAEEVLARLGVSGDHISGDDFDVIRDLVPGAISQGEEPTGNPERIGFLRLTEQGVGVPFGITHLRGHPARISAKVVGHDYLYSFGHDSHEAVDALRDILIGFAEIISREGEVGVGGVSEAVGASRRLRELVNGLIAREEECARNGTV